MTNVRMVQMAAGKAASSRPSSKAAEKTGKTEKTDTDFSAMLGKKAAAKDSEVQAVKPDGTKAREDESRGEDEDGQKKDAADVLDAGKLQPDLVVLFDQDASRAVPVYQEVQPEAPETAVPVGSVETEDLLQPQNGEAADMEMISENQPASGNVQGTETMFQAQGSRELQDAAVKTDGRKQALKAGEIPGSKEATDLKETTQKSQPESRGAADVQPSQAEEESFVQSQADGRAGKEPEESGQTPEGNMTGAMSHAAAVKSHETVSFADHTPKAAATVRTTSTELVQDVGKAIAARMPQKNGELTIELEPQSLGKITVRVTYEADRASVALISSNPKTLELLSRDAAGLAGIIEEKTGQETVVYTPQQESLMDDYQRQQHQPDGREQKKDERKEQSESFIQQFRLGLI